MTYPHIRFTEHAMLKFEVLRELGVSLDAGLIIESLHNPERILPGYGERLIAQAFLDEERVLRVVYEETDGEIVVITFYPGRRSRYE